MNARLEHSGELRGTTPRLLRESRFKMHLRLLRLGSDTYRVVTLRPGTKIGFSTNYFHQTWHIVTSQFGARLLGRLLWGLSYQRHRGTFLLIHGDHLLPTPFEAERSDPFLLIPASLTDLDSSALRILKSRLNHLGLPTMTIRWHTFGLDKALARQRDDRLSWKEQLSWDSNRSMWRQERMQRLGGFIVYSAPPLILRQQALTISRLRVGKGNAMNEMDYHYLAEPSLPVSGWADGEVQIFADYAERVAAAVQARRELVPNAKQPICSESLQVTVSRRRDQIKAQRARNRTSHRA